MAQNKPKRQIKEVTGATAFGAALTTVIIWILNAAWGIDLPGEVQGAVTTLIVLIFGWAVPPKEDEVVEETVDIEIDEPGDQPVNSGV